MANTVNTISGLIAAQLPDFINAKYAENAPSFRRFIELYYEWMEYNNPATYTNYTTPSVTEIVNDIVDSPASFDSTGLEESVDLAEVDDDYAAFTLPWSYRFLDKNEYTQVWVSTNSILSFQEPNEGAFYYNSDFSSGPNYSTVTDGGNSIFIGGNDGWCKKVYYGTTGTAPNREYKIRFEGYNDYTIDGAEPENIIWEAVFHENDTNKLDIKFATTNDTNNFNQIFHTYVNNTSVYEFTNGNAYTLKLNSETLSHVTSNTVYHIMNAEKYRDIDNTEDSLINHFKNELLPYFPETTELQMVKILKGAKEFYLKKGSEESIKWLFRVLFNKDAHILYPKDNILRASDGKWIQPISLKVSKGVLSNTANLSSLDAFKKMLVVGETTNARATVEKVYSRIDEYTSEEYYEIFISNVDGEFVNNEYITLNALSSTGTVLGYLNEVILGSISAIQIDPNNAGLSYNVGDPVVIYGGNDPLSDVAFTPATAEVSQITDGSIKSIYIAKRGYGFGLSDDANTSNANTVVTVTNDALDLTGNGAIVKVSEVDIANAISLTFATDTIAPYASVVLSGNPFSVTFPNNAVSNINSTLESCLAFEQVELSPLKRLTLANSGSGYQLPPTLDFSTYVIMNGSEPTDVKSFGFISDVEVVFGGSGYTTGEALTFTGGGGSGAAGTIVASGGIITDVTITDRGTGYTSRPTVGITSTGTGANLIAYLFNDGEDIVIETETFGEIQKFGVTFPGFGYATKPNVSLKIIDVNVSNIGDLSTAITEGSNFIAYQSLSDYENAFFSGVVDTYYTASSNGTVRVYNFNGAFDNTYPLILNTEEHLGVDDYTIYGNSLARANAVFNDGTVTNQGYFLNTDGFLSADKKLQDSYKYHNYSYVLQSEKQLKDYKTTLLNIAHPAGMKFIAQTNLPSNYTANVTSSVQANVAANSNTSYAINAGPLHHADYYFSGYSDLLDPFKDANDNLNDDPFAPTNFDQYPTANVNTEMKLALKFTFANLSNPQLSTTNTTTLLANDATVFSTATTPTKVVIDYADSNRKQTRDVVSITSSDITLNTSIFVYGYGLVSANGSKYLVASENVAGKIVANDGIRVFDKGDAHKHYRSNTTDSITDSLGVHAFDMGTGLSYSTGQRIRMTTTTLDPNGYVDGFIVDYDTSTGASNVDFVYTSLGTPGDTTTNAWSIQLLENLDVYAGFVINNPDGNIIELDRQIPISNSNLAYIIDPSYTDTNIKLIYP